MVKPFSLVPYLFILLFGMLVFYPIFDSGFLVSLDNPIHLAESYAFIDNLKETYWVSGWSMDAFVGYPLQLFPRYQLGLWLVAILNLVFSVPVNFAYKIVLFFSYVFPALALFFVTKKFFKSSLAALIPSFLFLLIRRDVVVTALTGQWNSLLALGLLIIFLYLTYSFFQKPNLKYSVITGLLFALIILSHPFAAFAAAMFFSIYFVVFWFKRHFSFRGLFYGFILFVIGALLCSFYILPLLDMPGWLDTAIGWPPTYNALALPYKVLAPFIFAVPKGVVTSQLFSALQTDFVLFLKLGWLYFVSSLPQLFIFVFGVIGLFYLFEGWKKKDSMGVFLTSLFIFILLCLVIGSGFWFLTPTLKNIPIFSNFQSYRFLVYVNISLLIFVSYAISNIRNDVYPKKLNHMYWLFDKRKIIFLILVLFFIANITAYLPDKSEIVTINDPSIRNDFFSLADWIKSNVDGSDTRVVYQDFYGNLDNQLIGSSHLPSMFYHYTGVYSVGGWYPSSSYPTDSLAFTSSDMFLGKDLDDSSDNFIADRMRLVNAKYVVAVNDKLENKLSNSALFKKEYENNIFKVFSLKDYKPEWLSYSGNFSYEMVLFDNDVVFFDYESADDIDVVVKFTYHPYWRAYLDGGEIGVDSNDENLVVLNLPEGSHYVVLSYEPFRWSYLIVTLITLIGCVAVLLFWRD